MTKSAASDPIGQAARPQGRVLIIAGSDSGGGAGIQADIKTVTALGGYAATAITAVTVQDTRDVYAIHPIPPEIVREQIKVVLNDLGADCVKIGMLGDEATINAVAAALDEAGYGGKLVLDPVMMAKGGARLIADTAEAALKRSLFLKATVITPNIPEAEEVGTMAIASVEDMEAAAQSLLSTGPQAVLLKGGHLDSPDCTDVLADENGTVRLTGERIVSTATHGTGCTLASAIATGLAQGFGLEPSIRRAQGYVRAAIRNAPGLGAGAGPMGHGFPCRFEG